MNVLQFDVFGLWLIEITAIHSFFFWLMLALVIRMASEFSVKVMAYWPAMVKGCKRERMKIKEICRM